MSKHFLYILLLMLPFFVQSQVVSDAKMWSSIGVKKKFNKLKLSLGVEHRLDENFSHTEKLFTELGAEYKIIKNLSGGFNYRFARESDYDDDNYLLNHRFDIGLEYQYKIKEFKLEYRVKYQTKTAPQHKNNPTYLRNKLTLIYKIENKKKDIRPYASYEFYYQFNNDRVINRSRLTFGTKFDLSKKSSIKCFYTFENRFNTKNLRHNHIYGIGYSLDI